MHHSIDFRLWIFDFVRQVLYYKTIYDTYIKTKSKHENKTVRSKLHSYAALQTRLCTVVTLP